MTTTRSKLPTVLMLLVGLVVISYFFFNHLFFKQSQIETETPTLQSHIADAAESKPIAFDAPSTQVAVSPEAIAASMTELPNEQSMTDKDANSVYGTGLPADKNDPQKLAERKQAYLDMSTILTNMARGEKAEDADVLGIADKVVLLTQDGYIPKQDAIHSITMLRKAFPELDISLFQHMQSVEAI